MLTKYALRTLSTLYPPQKPMVLSGVDSSLKLADLAIASGYRRPLIVTDPFLFEHGMVHPLLAHLDSHGCTATVFHGVTPNPTFDVVQAALDLCIENACDSVIVVGGGSAIDTAKVVAAAATDARGIERLVGVLKIKQPPLPFYAVPTTSGTGSEATTTAVISDSETHKKQFFVDPKYIPVAAALDPSLLRTLPPHITAATGMDALTHAIEAFTSTNSFADTDHDAKLAVKLLFKCLPRAVADGSDLQAREMVAQASFLAGFAFTKSSLGYVHAISHQVSAHYNTPHGLANAVILPRILRFNRTACSERYAELDAAVDPSGPGDVGSFIERVDRLSTAVGIPDRLDDLQEEDFAEIATEAIAEARSSYAVPKGMKRGHITAVLSSVKSGNADVDFRP